MKHTSKNIEIIAKDFLRKKRNAFIIILTLNLFTDNRLFWKTIKSHFSEKYTPSKKMTLLENDKIITNDNDIAGKLILKTPSIFPFLLKQILQKTSRHLMLRNLCTTFKIIPFLAKNCDIISPYVTSIYNDWV